MKQQLTSFDVYVLVQELSRLNGVRNIRLDKTYPLGKKELKIKLNIPGDVSGDLIIAPSYFCISSYPRPAPEVASSFAMQMRKRLRGGFIREIRQHGFDRIVEFLIEKSVAVLDSETDDESEVEKIKVKFILIAEFFSTGNVILCDENKKIIGLLEWQKWKDRKLGVGQTYEYPPKTTSVNPLEIRQQDFIEGLKNAGENSKIVSVLAKNMDLGGFYAEEVCLLSGLDKAKKISELSEDEMNLIFKKFSILTGEVKSGKITPSIVYSSNEPVDAVPLEFKTYQSPEFEAKKFNSFNEAIDEYFSKTESDAISSDVDKKFEEKIKKLEDRANEQRQAIETLDKKAEEYGETGELIYKNFQLVEKIQAIIRSAQKRGLSDDEILEKIRGAQEQGMEEAKYIKGLKHNELEIEFGD